MAPPAGRQYGTNVPGQPYVQNPHHWRDSTFKIVDLYKIPVGISLGVIAAILTTSIVASLLRARRLPKLEEPA